MALPFGGLPNRFDPESGPSPRRALIVPGVGYSPASPLLEFGRQALSQHGWSVHQLWWDVPRDITDSERQRWVLEQIDAAVAAERALPVSPQRWLIMGKSLGSRAVCSQLPVSGFILFTPLLTDPSVVSGLQDVVKAGVPVLLVGGTGDKLWSSETAKSLGCEVAEFEGADHALSYPGDAVHTAQAHAEVALAVDRFLTALSQRDPLSGHSPRTS